MISLKTFNPEEHHTTAFYNKQLREIDEQMKQLLELKGFIVKACDKAKEEENNK